MAAALSWWPASGFGQIIHTAHDHIPNFAANPTIRSAAHGSWSSPSTWTPARVPNASDVVSITHTVTYDSAAGDVDVIGVEAGAVLRFATSQSTRLAVGVLIVLPNGTLEIGTAATPVAATATAEIIIKNKPLNTSIDPDQYGTGLLAIDAMVTMHGAAKTPTFVRTSVEPRAGHTTVTLEQAVTGWRVGDRVFLPDTRQVPVDHWFNASWPLQVEERTIQSISGDGRTLTMSSALSFDHRGARDADGTATVLGDGTRLLPHVGNLTRNVVIRSENPSGTRGHTLYTRRADVKISYVQFQDLGRTRAVALNASTNHIGRYPIHIHHVWGPVNPSNTGYQFSVVGNAVNDSLKWPIAVHGSHFGLVKQNVVFGGSQLSGAGIAIEDGTETENLFEQNFVANIRGNTQPRDSGPGTADGTTPGSAAECFWSNGFNNRFVNNVAASCRNTVQQIVSGPGWKFIVTPAPYTARNPLFRGADMTDSTQTFAVTPQYQPIREFRGNEVYGLAADGLTAWQLGTDGYAIPSGIAESIVQDFRVWHTYEGAVYNYPAHRMTFDGLVYRVDAAATQYWPAAVQCGDYRHVAITIRGGSIHAGSVFGNCTDPLGTYTMENVTAVTRSYAFDFETPATPGTQADRPASGVTMVLRNNRISAWPGQSLRTIGLDHTTAKVNNQPNDPYTVFVYDYQGQAGNNFRAYFDVQASQNLYGGLAPCNDTTTRPEIRGITCPMSGTPPPSGTFGASPQTISPGQSATLTWNITGATSVSINQGIGTVAASGNRTVSPSATTTYTLTATNSAGSVTYSATVTVSTSPPPSATFSASPATISSGQSSTLSWTTSGATSVSINQGIGTVAATGTRNVSPTVTTTYTLTATNANGTTTRTATVTVGALPTASLSASPPSISAGQSSTLSWTTTNATSVTINQGIGGVGASGTRGVSPSATTTYTLTATNAVGSTTSSVTINVGPPSGLAGDFNGDGVSDVLSYNASNGNWSVYITGLGSVASGTWPVGLVLYATNEDANNLTDIFGYNPTVGAWLNAVNTGTSLATSTGTWWPGWQVYILDVDGIGADQVFLGSGAGRLIPVVSVMGPSKARPWISPDGLRLYFASNRASGSPRQDLFVASRPNAGSPFTSLALVAGVNSGASSSAPTLTPDELTIFYSSDALGGPDLWMASRGSRTAAFSTPIPVGPVNSPAAELDPEISPDGTILFFESNRPGGLGGSDVWASVRESAAGPFASPVNFAALNSSMNDGHPGINNDTAHLYFGSDRPGGGGTAQTWRKRLSCDSVSPSTINIPSKGALQSIAVADASSCGWVALTPQSWISITSAPSGNGGGTVTFGVPTNTGPTRSGTIRIGGRTVTITQKGRRSKGPMNLDAAVDGSTVSLIWQPPPEEATAGEPEDQPLTYVLEAGSAWGAADIVPAFAMGTLATSAVFQGVPNGTYYVRLRALYADYQSEPSNEIAITVGNGSCSGLPSVPGNFSYAVDGSLVTLTWSASSGSVNSYVISAGVVPGQFFLELDTGSNNTRFSGHAPPGTYYVRVRGRNHCGIGSGADIVVVVP